MGIYFNPGNDLFTEAPNSEIYVDKTMMIEVIYDIPLDEWKFRITSDDAESPTMSLEMLVPMFDNTGDEPRLITCAITTFAATSDG